MATYLASMKRLRAQYTRVDPDSTISDRAWAQRLLNRASLQRRVRLDVFYSAGGLYEADLIERALRHRCSNIHEDERKIPGYFGRGPDSSRSETSSLTCPRSRSTTASSASSSKSSWKSGSSNGRRNHAHVADDVLLPEEELEEDLEQEMMGERESESVEDRDAGFENLAGIPEVGEEELEADPPSESELGEAHIREAFTAGWRAKAKVGKKGPWLDCPINELCDACYRGRSLAEKKRISTCTSCGGRGRWKGDPECPHVQAGKDPPHAKRAPSMWNSITSSAQSVVRSPTIGGRRGQ